MSFSIVFLPNDHYTSSEPSWPGSIKIGDFEERFESSLEFWTKPLYECQWSGGVKRIVDGAPSSCLITSITNPRTANFIEWWALYRLSAREVAVQNQLLFLDALQSPFDELNPYLSIGERKTVSENGQSISEWRISVESLRDFLRRTEAPQARHSGG
jgi:hypothetical protein